MIIITDKKKSLAKLLTSRSAKPLTTQTNTNHFAAAAEIRATVVKITNLASAAPGRMQIEDILC